MKTILIVLSLLGAAFAQTTPNYSFNIPLYNSTLWNQKINANFTSLDSLLAGSPVLKSAFWAANVPILSYTVSTLPASPPTNGLAIATDGNGQTCATGSGSTLVLCYWNGTSWQSFGLTSVSHVTDMPAKFFIPAATCNNATPATTWSLPTSSAPTPTCATGTNTQVGTLNFADAQSAQATYYLPEDWDSSSSVDSSVFFTSSSTSGTVIFNLAAVCTNINGTQTDDQVFNSSVAYSTITLTATANALWSASLTGLTVTNCSAGELLHLKLTRATDTAADTGVAVRGVSLTVRRSF